MGVAPEDYGRHTPAGQRARLHLLPGNIIFSFKVVFAISGGHHSLSPSNEGCTVVMMSCERAVVYIG